MITLLKKLNLGAIIALVGIVGLTVSWKNHESTKLAPQSGWYTVSAPSGDINDPDDQIIGSFISTTPPNGDCAEANPADPCQVLLDLSQFTATSVSGLSVTDATDTTHKGKVDVANSNNDGYAREAN